MRRFFTFAGLLLALGCAPSNPGLIVNGVLAIPDNCIFNPTNEIYQLAPTLDTGDLGSLRPMGIRYLATLRITNGLLALYQNRFPLRAEPNVLTIEYAEVNIMQVDGTSFNFGGLPNPFRVAAGATVPPSSTAGGTPGVVSVEVIPPVYGESLGGTTGRILVGVRLTGRTAGDATITSGEYVFPIDLCTNCLVFCDPMLDMLELGCLLGQDRTVTVPASICVP